jgi:hypothetical protein
VTDLHIALANWTKAQPILEADTERSEQLKQEVQDQFYLITGSYSTVMNHYSSEGIDTSYVFFLRCQLRHISLITSFYVTRSSYVQVYELWQPLQSYMNPVKDSTANDEDEIVPTTTIQDIEAFTANIIQSTVELHNRYMEVVTARSDPALSDSD